MWPGVDAVGRRDYPVIQGTTVILGIAVVIMNLISDLLYHVFDPRVQLRMRELHDDLNGKAGFALE